MTTTRPGTPPVTDPAPTNVLELRLPVDATEAPLGYDDQDGILAVEIALAGGGYANLVLPVDDARAWAGELFAALAVAYRETTGDPHALTDYELASLSAADGYDPGPGPLVLADDHGPAVVRFHAVLDIQGECVAAPELRARIVEALARFNTTRIAVTAGEPLTGRVNREPTER